MNFQRNRNDKTFTDKASGKDTKRPQLQECLQYLRPGDRLHVHSMDRLARNLVDLQKMVEQLTGCGIAVEFHKEGLIFTGNNDHIQKLMLQIMGAIAEFERANIRERQREGIAKAKASGKRWGRKAALNDDQVQAIIGRIEGGEERTAIARDFGITRQTLYRTLKKRDLEIAPARRPMVVVQRRELMAPPTLDDPAINSAVIDQIRTMPGAADDHLIWLPELRAAMNLSKNAFNKAIITLIHQDILIGHRHVHAARMNDQERAEMVTDGVNFFCGVTVNEENTP